jgi:surface antigen
MRRWKTTNMEVEPTKMRMFRFVLALSAAMLLVACLPSVTVPVVSAPVSPEGPRPVTGWLAGPVGQQLDPADRERAFVAQISAAETGRRASWRSAKGNFGFVEPGPEGAGVGGTCRPFSHTIYIDGRAQRGTGSACKAATGSWDVVS